MEYMDTLNASVMFVIVELLTVTDQIFC
jgi:hypothetical protein